MLHTIGLIEAGVVVIARMYFVSAKGSSIPLLADAGITALWSTDTLVRSFGAARIGRARIEESSAMSVFRARDVARIVRKSKKANVFDARRAIH